MSPEKRAGGSQDAITINGASANNLRDVDVRFPLRAATLVVGVSGSGKSSLLADTLAKAGNGRMKRFLGVAQDHLPTDDDVPAFVGPLPASIHFSQGAFRASRRTTVATCSGLLATLRQLYLRHGSLWSDVAKQPVPPPSPDSYAQWLGRHYSGKLTLWAVPMRFVAGDGLRQARSLSALGIKRAVVRSETDSPETWEKGKTVSLENFRPLNPNVRHILEAEIATLALPTSNLNELSKALKRTFEAGKGTVVLELPDAGTAFAELSGPRGLVLDSDLHHVHPVDPRPYASPSQALLSFNMPSSERSGACASCEGIGDGLEVPEEFLVVHPQRSLHAGAFALWTSKNYKYINVQHETIEGLRGVEGFDPDRPWNRLSRSAQKLVLQGGLEVTDRDRGSGRKLSPPRPFEGIASAILRRYRKGGKTATRLAPFVREGPCEECSGSRWSYQARALRVGGRGLADLLALSFSELVETTGPRCELVRQSSAARALVAQLQHHAKSFVSVGLGHLSGDRGMLTLSEGESRRLRLAGLLNVRGRNLALLLDEPARGLHEQDINKLVRSLRELKRSHTVILNDHRFSLARATDHVIELGPGAGNAGGQLVRAGLPNEILGRDRQRIVRGRLAVSSRHPSLRIRGGFLHNVQNVSCRIPLGRLVTVTGVSGSGKSNFVRGILLPALANQLGDRVVLEDFATRKGSWRGFTGCDGVREVLALEQRRPEANRRSLVATFLGIADTLRRVYAKTPEARRLSLGATDFGLNAGKGRCGECLGIGELRDATGWLPCPGCGGRRFGESVQSVRSEGLSMVDLLEVSVTELAGRELGSLAQFADLFSLLEDLDLGYLSLGRRVDQLSGGEVQRLRIAHRLWQAGVEGLLLILDEPSAGLHPADIARLLKVLDRIVAEGRNTVLLVEHQLDLIRASDWVIDFGPGGGPAGGRVLAQGPPEEIRTLDTPTGTALRRRASLPSGRKHNTTSPTQSGCPSADEARQARRWLQILLGHEVKHSGDDGGISCLGVEVDSEALAACRPLEIGGLDRELARLFLLADQHPSRSERIAEVVGIWLRNPEAQLFIHPLLHALQVWGLRPPRSELRLAMDRLGPLGLDDLVESLELSGYRAGGSRFQTTAKTSVELQSLLDDALVIGGGYVELQNRDGEVLATLQARALSIESGIVAPASPTSEQLCRGYSAGRCPTCRGKGWIPEFDAQLVFKNRRESLESEQLFRPEALAILKGVRRLTMLPFFRRFAEEGLWVREQEFSRLDTQARNVFLHGYWFRPGPGSFLKNRKADPAVVGSWLSWDGIYRAVISQLDRSSHLEWAEAVRGTFRQTVCIECEGSGLVRYSRVIQRDGRSLHDWTVTASIGELYEALRGSKCRGLRERSVLNRLVKCLEPLIPACASARLDQPLKAGGDARLVYERVVQAFTQLPLVAEP